MRAFRTRFRAPTSCRERLESVLRVIYLVFNEGYSASSGASVTRVDLSGEAIRLGRLLVELLPEPEAIGLLALMLLHESRRAARSSASGELILLDDQDRSLWNRKQIDEGRALVEQALASRRFGPYTIQAAIAAVHADAASAEATDWDEIVGLYDVLLRIESVAGHRAESRRRGGDARRSCGRARADRSDPRARRARRLPSGARRAGGPVPAPRRTRGRRGRPTNAPSRSSARSRNAGFSSAGWPS